MAIDGLGHFLFVIDTATSGIWMFQIQSDGSLAPPKAGPVFATDPLGSIVEPGAPVSLATEPSGKFLYVGYETSARPGYGIILGFAINTLVPGDPQLTQIPSQQAIFVQAIPIGMAANSKGTCLYVGLQGTGQDRGTNVYEIGSDGGLLYASTDPSANANERSIAIDPLNRFLFEGWGSQAGSGNGFLQSLLISTADGSLLQVGSPISLGESNIPRAMLLDSSGKYLYVSALQNGASLVYSVDASGNLAASSATIPNDLSFKSGTAVADPQGPYIYSLLNDGIHAFVVDATTGNIAAINGSPFQPPQFVSAGIGGLAMYAAPMQTKTGPAAQLFPPSLTFPSITTGQTSSTQFLNITNTGTTAVTLTKVTLSGAGAANFAETPNCSLPALLQAGNTIASSCSISVTFTPTTSGQLQAALTTMTDTANSQTSQLSGTGVAATSSVTLSPGSLAFPSTLQGATSASQSVLLTNSGAAPLHITSVLASGANPGDFAIAPGGCSAGTYAANATCTITVTFSPLGDGARNASIIVADDAPGSTQSIPLSGTGTGAPVPHPAATITPPSLAFSAVAQGTTSVVQNITVTSSGTGSLHISNVQLAGANVSDFKMIDGCTATGYLPGQACTLGLTFTPSAPGTRFATITISDDGPNSPQTISITGNSSAPTPSLTVSLYGTSSYSQTVSAGQTASFALQLVSNFNGTVTFAACSGAPTSATCTVPTPMTVSTNVSTPFAISIATAAPASSLPTPPRFETPPHLTPAFFLCVSILLLYFATRTSSNHLYGVRRPCAAFDQLNPTAALSLAAILAVALSFSSGCGGASTVAQALPVTTPSQTYTITIKPSATTSNNTPVTDIAPIQLVLTVD